LLQVVEFSFISCKHAEGRRLRREGVRQHAVFGQVHIIRQIVYSEADTTNHLRRRRPALIPTPFSHPSSLVLLLGYRLLSSVICLAEPVGPGCYPPPRSMDRGWARGGVCGEVKGWEMGKVRVRQNLGLLGQDVVRLHEPAVRRVLQLHRRRRIPPKKPTTTTHSVRTLHDRAGAHESPLRFESRRLPH
jgi:hypothetical protein